MSDAGNWSRVREIFGRALERDPPLRAAFVREACGDDSRLHAEVSSLLAAHVDAGSIAEGSPLAVLDASAVSSLGHGLRAGDRLGLYDVVGPLGAGGMGEVYEARDTLLGRRVAIKILSADLALDASARDRLVREAKALAALNHPNIGAIYGVETTPASDGSGRQSTALVLELIEGLTLAQRVARGPLSVADALRTGAQIAGALEAAHDKGIIHRDLKPANIKVTPAGIVKVLDFGLAKALDPDRSADAVMPTATLPGTILGTPAYMSPEQVRGEDVDKRTDVWAFGCVLFELLTSRRAFAGNTASDCMAAVLEREPNWPALPQATPQSIRLLLRRCLQKDQAKRLRDLGDARFALEDASTPPEPAAKAEPGKQRWIAVTLLALTAAALAALATWIVMQPGRVAAPPVVRFEITPVAPDVLNVATTTSTLAISADGTRLAYASGGRDNGGPLVVRDIGDIMPHRVDGAPLVRDPFFSPDGQWIGFTWPGLKKIPTAGGTPVVIVPDAVTVRGASWADDGAIIYATTDAETGLLRISDAGGTTTVLTKPNSDRGEADHVLPFVLPGGRGILFTILDTAGNNPRVAVLDARDQSQKVLIPGAAVASYIDAGYLVYAASGTLFAVRFNLDALTIESEPMALADGVLMGDSQGAYYAVSRTGTIAYVPATATPDPPRTLVWVDRKGIETPLNTPPRPYRSVRLSPDGQRIAVAINDQQRDVWTWDVQRETLTQVTTESRSDSLPIWTPDGQHLVFVSRRGSGGNLYRQRADGTGVAEQLTQGLATFVATSVHSNGSLLVGNSSIPRSWTLFVLPLGKREPPQPLLPSPSSNNLLAALSPDGRFIAYQSSETGSAMSEIQVRPFPGVNARSQVSRAGGANPVWARNGRELFFLDGSGRLTSVSADTTGEEFRYGPPVRVLSTAYPAGYLLGYDVSPDGTRFVMIKEDPAARPPNTPIVVVLNAVIAPVQISRKLDSPR